MCFFKKSDFVQLPSRVQGPVTNGDVSESLDSESLESVLYHYSFSNMTPLDVQIIQRLVDRWHMAHYDLQWDIDQRSEVSGIAHLKFFFGVRQGLSPLDTLRLCCIHTQCQCQWRPHIQLACNAVQLLYTGHCRHTVLALACDTQLCAY